MSENGISGINIHQRINGIMSELPFLKKNKKVEKNGVTLYSVISADGLDAELQPLLIKYKVNVVASVLSHSQDGNRTVVDVVVRWVNIDNPDDFFETSMFGYGVDNQDKGPGKAITYAIRYAKIKALNIPCGDKEPEDDQTDHDPNGNGNGKPKQTPDDIPIGASDSHTAVQDLLDIYTAQKKCKPMIAIKKWANELGMDANKIKSVDDLTEDQAAKVYAAKSKEVIPF